MADNSRLTLLHEGTGAFTATFTVGGTQRQVGVFVSGLTGGETCAVELLTARDKDQDDAGSGDWMACKVDGVAVVFSADDNLRSFLVPGVYRLNCAAASGTVRAGVYY